MRRPEFTPAFLTPQALADQLRPQMAAAEMALLNAWAEMEDAHLTVETATKRLQILAALWPSEIPTDAAVQDS